MCSRVFPEFFEIIDTDYGVLPIALSLSSPEVFWITMVLTVPDIELNAKRYGRSTLRQNSVFFLPDFPNNSRFAFYVPEM